MIRVTLCLALLATSLGLQCRDGQAASCQCQNQSLQASFELFCPSYQTHLQKLHIVVEPGSFAKMTCSNGATWPDIVTNIGGLDLGNIKTFKMINCPVPVDSFASMLGMMGVDSRQVERLTLTLVAKGDTNLQGYHFANMTALIELELPRAEIKKVDKTFFENLHGLKSLDLTDNRGIVIDPASFHELKELQLFQCHSCYIQSLHEDTFKGLAKLRRISLHDNKLAQLPQQIFAGLAGLEDLKLTRNLLTRLPVGLFDTTTNLTDVDIGYNRFENLPDKLFANKANFKRFTMVANGVCQPYRGCIPGKSQRLVLAPTMFQDSTVGEIKINHSPIKEIPADLFSGCKNLVNLTIQHSLIEALPATLFRDMETVTLIDFSGNQLKVLEIGLFEGLANVEKLRFIDNNLTRLDEGLLTSMTKLKTFHFHENHLLEIPQPLFRANKRLQEINLEKNNLSNWPDNNPHVFEDLRTLNLAFNKMTSIPQRLGFNMLGLKVLNMSHNLLGLSPSGQMTDGRLKPVDIQFLQKRLNLDLSFNEIKMIDLWDTPLHLKSKAPSGITLNLTGNPLACDCWATELKQKLEGKLDNGFEDLFALATEFGELRCSATNPPSVAGKLLADVTYDDLVCPFPSNSLLYNCTDRCRCNLSRYNKATLIDCTDLNMTTFPTSLPLIRNPRLQIYTEEIKLNMTGNQLHNLTQAVEAFTSQHTNKTHYQAITSLELTDTSMVHFDHACLPPRLKSLALDHNRLGFFTQGDINFFDGLIRDHGLELKLGRNPYNCTCGSRPLFNFIKNRGSKVTDLDDVAMECDDGKPARKMWKIEKLEEFCTTGLPPVVKAAIAVIIVFLVLVIAFLVFWTVYREHILIWVYSKMPWLFPRDLIDQDKPYDVFLSYSHEDGDWVEQYLAEGLEKPVEKDLMHYKCCIHTRDWKVGEMIPDQIVQSVESSRRTLIVLSKAYIESMWTKLEFRAAHTQALQDKTQRVILVVRGSLPESGSMEEDLQRYISLNTYLDSEDPWFWHKLRYALPHRGGGWRQRVRTRRETDRMELMRSAAELELGRRSPSPPTLLDAATLAGPRGLTGGPRLGLVSPLQHGGGKQSNGVANGHVGNQVIPAQ